MLHGIIGRCIFVENFMFHRYYYISYYNTMKHTIFSKIIHLPTNKRKTQPFFRQGSSHKFNNILIGPPVSSISLNIRFKGFFLTLSDKTVCFQTLR